MKPRNRNSIKVLLDLFLIFFYVDIFTVGGGIAMLPILEKTLVEGKKYMTEKDFLELFSLTQILPGSFMIHMAAFIGYRIIGFPGALVCSVAIALPPLIIITLIAIFFNQFIQFELVKKLMLGILAGVVGEVSGIIIKMTKKVEFDVFKIILLGLAFALIFFIKLNPIYVILIGGLIGISAGLIRNEKRC